MLKHPKLLQYFVFVEENLQVNRCLLLAVLRTFLGFSCNLDASEGDVFCV